VLGGAREDCPPTNAYWNNKNASKQNKIYQFDKKIECILKPGVLIGKIVFN
jgi:hypothetical protein